MREGTVCLVGDGAVGKSSIVSRLMGNQFASVYDPTLEDRYTLTMEVGGEICKVCFMDTSGQDEFASLLDRYIQGAHILVVVYDVNRHATLTKARKHLQDAIRRKNETGLPTKLILVGNKIDTLQSDRDTEKKEVEILASASQAKLKWTSALTDEGIDELRQCILQLLPEVITQQRCCTCVIV